MDWNGNPILLSFRVRALLDMRHSYHFALRVGLARIAYMDLLLNCLLLITHLHIHRNSLGSRGDIKFIINLLSHLFTSLVFIRPIFFFCATIRKPFLANKYETPLHIVVVATSHLLAEVNIAFFEKNRNLLQALQRKSEIDLKNWADCCCSH